ncbi:MAG: GAF domain-containing protein [bacterium]
MKNIDLKKLLTVGDLFTIGLVILGFLIAVFVDMVSMKIIGISLSILGIVRSVMILTYRINLMMNANKLRTKPASQDYKTTERKDKKAKRLVIEDFPSGKVNQNNEVVRDLKDYTKEITEEEGFRLLDENSELSQQQPQITTTEDIKLKFDSSEIQDFEFEEEFSGMKVVNKEKQVDEKITIDTTKEESNVTETQELEIEKKPESYIKINEDYKREKIDIPLSDLMETDPASGLEPRKEFEYLLTRVLKIVKGVTNTKTAVFILVNSDRKELIIEAFDSDVPGLIAARRRIPFGNDIVSQIGKSMKPEILTEISPSAELDLIPYYTKNIGISSFFGMPVFFNNSIIGVLCVDSEETNSYDTSIVSLFGNFAKLIGNLVKSYTAKYDLLQDSRTLSAVNQFREMLNKESLSLKALYDSLLDSAKGVFENAITGVIGFDTDLNQWIVLNSINKNYPDNIENGLTVSPHSLAGSAVYSDKIVVNVPNISDQVRINEREIKLDSGFFIAVPLKSFTGNYGALFVEGVNSSDVTSYEVNILTTLTSHAASTIEQLHFADMLKKGLLFDPLSGLLNTPAFMKRLNEEVLRSIDFGYPLTLCLIKIDKYQAIDPKIHPDRSELVLQHVLEIIQSKLRPYDLLGRADSNIFGVVLIDVAINDAKTWAEKLRSDVAISIVKIKSDSFSVTISMGVAQLGKDEALNDIFDNAKEMLKLSAKNANTVTVFE